MKKDGISLIVLVITIIVIIILAGAVILSLASNNPISQASKATYLSDVKNFETELGLYETKQFENNMGAYNPKLLQADEASVIYNTGVIEGKTIDDLIPTLGKTTKYSGQFIVIDGELVYQGKDTNRQTWSTDVGIKVEVAGEPKVNILPPAEIAVSPGTDIVYTIKFSSNVALTTVDLTNKVEVLDESEVALTTQPIITIGTVSGTSSDLTRQVDITIKTNSLAYGEYKLKIKSGSVINADNVSNSQDKISLVGFDITDTVPPENPTMSANPTAWTNGNVTVTINYSSDSVVKEYSTDEATWNIYTIPAVVNTNNTTIYARGKDAAGNISGVASITITNIDKTAPTVAYGTNGGNNVVQVSTTVTVSDAASGINTSTLQYVWDTQNVTTPVSGWTTFTNGGSLTKTGDGSYYLWIKATDNVSNIVSTKSNIFTVGEVAEIVSTVQSVNKTFSGLTSGYSYNNPVIPAGFVAVDTADASWNNLSTDWNKGLVIQDVSENQFVWVPVDGTNVPYEKWCNKIIAYSDVNISDDTAPSGFNVSKITTTYKGFYIARYEAMFDYNGGSIRVASRKSLDKTTNDWSTTRNAIYNGYLWNFINYTDAKMYAENMDTSYGYDTTKVGTNLITGAEWDTAMKWWGIWDAQNSRGYGNYIDSTTNVTGYGSLQVSGYSYFWKAKNIYDLAGNLNEWTSEKYSTQSAVVRSGQFNASGYDAAAGMRGTVGKSSFDYSITFRPALYVL